MNSVQLNKEKHLSNTSRYLNERDVTSENQRKPDSLIEMADKEDFVEL